MDLGMKRVGQLVGEPAARGLIDEGLDGRDKSAVAGKPNCIVGPQACVVEAGHMDGCGGGAQNVESEAQRYPEDYDGLSVTGFSYNTRHKQEQMWIWEAAQQEAASNIPPDKFKVLHTAVLNKCDAIDGVKDGVIEDPRRCVFDPKEIECKGADSPSCLTAPQAE